MSNDQKRIAIVPGSFDPITLGHVDIVQRAAERYDRVYVAVMINRDKKYMFTLSQREQIANAAIRHIPNATVISSEGMLWELAMQLGACALVKGYRNEIDREYEKKMAQFNAERYPEAKTELLLTQEGYAHISSTAVRERLLNGEPLTDYVPQAAIDEIYKIFPRRL